MHFEDEKYWQGLINQGLIRFFLLKVIYTDKEIHGYKLVKRIEEVSEGLCRPTESTIYPALEQLMSGGYLEMIKVSATPGQTAGSENSLVRRRPSGSATGKKVRKVYSLNEKGRSAFRAAAKAYGEILPILRRSIML